MLQQQFHKHKTLKLFNPLYIPIWFGILFLQLITKLPFKWQRALGAGLGKVAYLILRERRRICKINIALCFPELSFQAQQQLVKQNFKYLGIGIFESAFAWFASAKRLQNLFIVNNYHHFINARHNQGTLLLTPHCYSLELCGRFFSQEPYNLQPTFRHLKNPVFNYVIQKQRGKIYKNIFYKQDLKAIISALKNKALIWNAADQDFGIRHSVFAPFFQYDTATITSISKLASLTQASVMPAEYYYDTKQQKYIVNLYPAINNFPNNLESDAIKMNSFFETIIKKNPEQYFWVHRRFKTQPKSQLINFYKTYLPEQVLDSIINTGKIIKTNRFGPKLILHDNYFVKIFTKKSGFSSTIYKSYATRFVKNAQQLKQRSLITVNPYIYNLKTSNKSKVIIYKSLDGKDLRSVFNDADFAHNQTLLNKFAYYLTDLHAKGIFFRSLHLGNVLLTAEANFALIDISDVRFNKIYTALSIKKRIRNIKHMFNDPNDKPFWMQHGKEQFLKIYLANCNFSTKIKHKFLHM